MSGAPASRLEGLVYVHSELPDWRRLRAVVESVAPVGVEAHGRREGYLDTFDWRLHRRGMRLAFAALADAPREGFVARLERADAEPLTDVLARIPAFAGDFPAGPVGEAIAAAIGVRRLLPIVTVEGQGHLLRVLDPLGKTTVRIVCLRRVAHAPGDAARPSDIPRAVPLLPAVRLEPVLGYPGAATRVAAVLAAALAARPEADGTLVEALAAIGRSPGDYASKLRVAFAPEVRAGEAFRTILAALLHAAGANEAGALHDLDIEFLHDFRVALRRTRSVLSQGKRVLGEPLAAGFRVDLRWLGAVSGPVRDLDVWRLELARLLRGPGADLAAALAPLARLVDRRHGAARRRLNVALGSERYARFRDGWRGWVESPGFASGPDAERAAAEIAASIIGRAARRLLRDGRSLGEDASSPALHRLRIQGKRLRYALEHLGPLLDPGSIRPFVRAQKRLQDRLGELNDLSVQIAGLEADAEVLLTDAGGTPTLVAIGRLAERLSVRRERARARAARAFSTFDARAGGLRAVLRW